MQIHSLSPAEVIHVAQLSSLSMSECLRRLQAAGLDSVPGGGAEVLVDEVRKEIVITSYSIHYTKLYDGCCRRSPLIRPRQQND